MPATYNKYKCEIVFPSETNLAPAWKAPSDWIDISDVGTNEVNLLVKEGSGIAFSIVTDGTFSVDWGDGTIANDLTTGTKEHQYITGGTPCSLGYNTWKIHIYNASANITEFKMARHSFAMGLQYCPVLSAVIDLPYVITFNGAFYASDNYCRSLKSCVIKSFASATSTFQMFKYCHSLVSVSFPEDWGSVNSIAYMFSGCITLNQIKLPSSFGGVITGLSAFEDCENLVYVTGLKSWGSLDTVSRFFANCSSFISVELPDSWGIITNASNFFENCKSIVTVVLPVSWGSVTTAYSFFKGCSSLSGVNLPTSWGSVASTAYMFNLCASLSSVNLPSSWGNITTVAYMFASCDSLVSVNLPSSWGNITTVGYMFNYCFSLTNITLPASWGSITTISYLFGSCCSLTVMTLPGTSNDIVTANYAFVNCYNLKSINNIDYLGSTISPASFSSVTKDCFSLVQNIAIGALLSAIAISGTSPNKTKISSIRLTNPSSPFGGSPPHVDVSYNSLSLEAIELLFSDLPSGLAISKTINITGNDGAVAAISKSNCGVNSNSTTVTQSDTSSLVVGMEVYGTGINSNRAVTFQDSGDTVTRTAHGFNNDRKVMFTSITTTTGIILSTTYYVINATANTFQVSNTLGGAALALTNNGSGYVIIFPVIVTINTNVNVILDIPCFSTSSIVMTAGTLKRSIAYLKGWAVTG